MIQSFVTCHVILLEVVVTRWVHCGYKGMEMVSNNIQVDQENVPHFTTTPAA